MADGQTLTIGGLPLHVVDQGTGPPVLLVHGMGLDQRMWEPQVGALVDAGHRVIRYDARGHGRSAVPATGYALEFMQQEALGVLDALAVDRCDVVGLSMGGSIAAHLAVRHPARVRTVTVLSSMASGYPDLSPFVGAGGTAHLLDAGIDLPAFREQRLANPLFAETLEDPVAGPPLRQILLEALQSTAVLTELADERRRGWPAPTDWDLWIAPDRPVPALVMAGALDDATFTGFTRDSAELPRTRAVLVPNARHMCNMSHPELVNRELLALLDCDRDGAAPR
jgi:pimeloyl-ACP methyl ester carboxylesterase